MESGQTEIRPREFAASGAGHRTLRRRGLGHWHRAVQKAVDNLHLPSSIRVEYGGLYAEERKSSSDMLVVLFWRCYSCCRAAL